MARDKEIKSRRVVGEGSRHRGHISVGSEYQAAIPDCQPGAQETKDDLALKWCPSQLIDDENNGSVVPEETVSNYVQEAWRLYRLSEEDALAVLLESEYDIDKALSSLSNYETKDEGLSGHMCSLSTMESDNNRNKWTSEECNIFDCALAFLGKDFNTISRLLGNKPVSSVISHYYAWKRLREEISIVGAPICIDKSIRQAYQEMMAIPQCDKCGIIKSCDQSAGNLNTACQNCEKIEYALQPTRMPALYGLYFNKEEFDEIINGDKRAMERDQQLVDKWTLACREFQRLKQDEA